MTQLTIELLDKTFKEAYGITYNKDTKSFQIPDGLDLHEDDLEEIEFMKSEYKKLLEQEGKNK